MRNGEKPREIIRSLINYKKPFEFLESIRNYEKQQETRKTRLQITWAHLKAVDTIGNYSK